jgi:type IV secretion system protein VirD4
MQLPSSDEIVLVSGCPPIRAKKIRYFQDRRLKERVLPPPQQSTPSGTSSPGAPLPNQPAGSPWANLIAAPTSGSDADNANGGPRREPELPEHEDIAPAPPDRSQEFDLGDESDDTGPPIDPSFDQQVRNSVRQAPLDPADHLGM